jgi:deazaflavin-dependent oxidoreductase (nitroreductase family)
MKLPTFLWKIFRLGPRVAYALGLGPIIGEVVLLLTTIGRNSGKSRVTPLTYGENGNNFYVASARGPDADWLKNIAKHPRVKVRVGRRQFAARGEVVTEAAPIADYLQLQMERNPKLFARILRMEGLPDQPSRSDLEMLAARRPMVILHPI